MARKPGRALGAILAEQHAAVRDTDIARWLPHRPPWPEPPALLWPRLTQLVTHREECHAVARVLRRYEDQLSTPGGAPVLVHGDLGFHNVAFDGDTDEVRGVFDYRGAAWADRHQDFRYLVFPDGGGSGELEEALEVYESALGLVRDREMEPALQRCLRDRLPGVPA